MPDGGVHTGDEFSQSKGLGDKIIRAEFKAEHDIKLFSDGGKHDDGDIRATAQLFAKLGPRHVRRTKIRENDVWLLRLEKLESSARIGRESDGIAHARQPGFEISSVGSIVVDYEHRARLSWHLRIPRLHAERASVRRLATDQWKPLGFVSEQTQ